MIIAHSIKGKGVSFGKPGRVARQAPKPEERDELLQNWMGILLHWKHEQMAVY